MLCTVGAICLGSTGFLYLAAFFLPKPLLAGRRGALLLFGAWSIGAWVGFTLGAAFWLRLYAYVLLTYFGVGFMAQGIPKAAGLTQPHAGEMEHYIALRPAIFVAFIGLSIGFWPWIGVRIVAITQDVVSSLTVRPIGAPPSIVIGPPRGLRGEEW